MTTEVISKPESLFRSLSDAEKEKVMIRVRALISNGYMRNCLLAFGISKLENQLIRLRDSGILRITKIGDVEMYDFKNCTYKVVPVTIGGRRPRRVA